MTNRFVLKERSEMIDGEPCCVAGSSTWRDRSANDYLLYANKYGRASSPAGSYVWSHHDSWIVAVVDTEDDWHRMRALPEVTRDRMIVDAFDATIRMREDQIAQGVQPIPWCAVVIMVAGWRYSLADARAARTRVFAQLRDRDRKTYPTQIDCLDDHEEVYTRQ
jgi:hypothetical protein